MMEFCKNPVLGNKRAFRWKLSSHHSVARPPKVPLVLTAFLAFIFQSLFYLRVEELPLLSLSLEARECQKNPFSLNFGCFWFDWIPQPPAIPRDDLHYLPKRKGVITPFGGLVCLLLPSDISIVDWLPCIFNLSSSSSLASFRDFLPTFLEIFSMESLSKEPKLSTGFFLIIFA